jgi:N-acetylglucosamine kinase-like BadF-type ATPase
MKFVVVESGGTKSTWLFSDRKERISAPGLNPFEIDERKELDLNHLFAAINLTDYHCFFYGSGCENKNGASTIRTLLEKLGFLRPNINVNTDLLAACRALMHNQAGTVGILGTGAISAVYDGEKVIRTFSGLGALLGDEGSGFDIGKRLLKAYFYEKLDEDLNRKIEFYFEGRSQIIPTVYGPNGRMKVAGLTKLLGEYRENPIIKVILSNAFEDFYSTALHPIAAEGEVSLIGSIAYYFEKEIKETLHNCGYKVNTILPSADKALFEYHKTRVAK